MTNKTIGLIVGLAGTVLSSAALADTCTFKQTSGDITDRAKPCFYVPQTVALPHCKPNASGGITDEAKPCVYVPQTAAIPTCPPDVNSMRNTDEPKPCNYVPK
jgi:hypothetical protein